MIFYKTKGLDKQAKAQVSSESSPTGKLQARALTMKTGVGE